MTRSALHRRTVLAGLGTGTAALAGCTTEESGAPLSAENRWLQHGRDAANTSYAPDANGPTDEPEVDWRYEFGESFPAAQPLVAETVVVNAAGDGCYRIDRDTGDLRWRDDGNYDLHTPAIADESVYLPQHQSLRAVSTDGGYEVLGRRFRYERWERKTPQPGSPVTHADGALVFGANDAPMEGALVAIDDDGSDRWSIPVETQVEGPPAVADGTVVAVDRGAVPSWEEPRDVRAYAVALESGELEWSHTFGTSDEVAVNWLAGPVAGDRLVYVPTTRAVVAFDVEAGSVVWRHEVDDGLFVSPALADGTLIVGTSAGELLALDAESGDVRWRNRGHDEWLYSPTVANETVYTIGETGVVRGWTLGGDELFRVDLGRVPGTQPAVGDGRLYVPTDDTLYALR